ncbi:MAG TPA: hypothetical protein ENH49_01235 [Candidatus Marinimicrobia bacterium]|nr:hypothetical protein [Candidatus Neomarinimicrobiota bacterium]
MTKPIVQIPINTSLWSERGSVKGAHRVSHVRGQGIYLPLTGSGMIRSLCLRYLNSSKIIVNNFLILCSVNWGQNKGQHSNNCFIAMSFSENVKDIRTALKNVCDTTKYKPILIDEIEIDSDSTINDAIIANLKKSKFCIADFTEQNDGVYFESGFALGQGKKVIYTCREDWFSGENGKSHFDTDHFPHIIYKDINELEKKLIDRINAWV